MLKRGQRFNKIVCACLQNTTVGFHCRYESCIIESCPLPDVILTSAKCFIEQAHCYNGLNSYNHYYITKFCGRSNYATWSWTWSWLTWRTVCQRASLRSKTPRIPVSTVSFKNRLFFFFLLSPLSLSLSLLCSHPEGALLQRLWMWMFHGLRFSLIYDSARE